MGNLEFRIGTDEDVPLIKTFIEAAFRAEDSRPNWVNDGGFGKNLHLDPEFVSATASHPDKEWLLFFQPGTDDVGQSQQRLVGCCGVRLQEPGVTRLSFLSVDSSLQRSGVGRMVVAEAEGFARQRWNATVMELNAIQGRDLLLAWYERLGYAKTGAVHVEQLENVGEVTFVTMQKKLVGDK